MDILGIIEKLKKSKKLSKDKQVAALLGLSEQDFNNRKKRGSLLPLILDWALNENVNLNWLFRGEGDQQKSGMPLEQIPRPYCTFVKNLGEIPKDIRTEDYMTIPLVEGSIAAGEPIISPDKIEGWAVIHVSQVGRRGNLVAIRLDKKDGKSMEPLIRAGSMVAIDRDDQEIRKNRVYAVRTEWGATIKHLQREGDILIMIPRNPDRDTYPIQLLDLKALTYDPIIGRVIWNWQTL